MNHIYIKSLLSKIKNNKPKVLVLGDVMLDKYIVGDVKRISPEAPVPILNFEREKKVLGGAANVVHNLVNIGAEVSIGTMIGSDLDGELILNLLKKLNVKTNYICKNKNMNTTVKTRFLSGGVQLLRDDRDSSFFANDDFIFFEKKYIKEIKQFKCIVISDYNKGFCTRLIIQNIIKEAKKENIPVIIDPKGSDWTKYMNATSLTPNKKEVEEILNIKLKDNLAFEKAAKIIKENFKLKSCLITRGSEGMTYYAGKNIIHQKVEQKEVFDVSGAGDTVIACLAASVSSGLSIDQILSLCGSISSEVVTHVGTTPFNNSMLKYYE